jgi:hypothetical protein
MDFGVFYDAKEELAIGFWLEVDGKSDWQSPDPPDVMDAGMWLASNEPSFKKGYRTTRRDCGFAIVFNDWRDAHAMHEWLLTPTPVSTGADVLARFHRRRSKHQQLPGPGDRKWSARLDKALVATLRLMAYSPFSRTADGNLMVPVTLLRGSPRLNW